MMDFDRIKSASKSTDDGTVLDGQHWVDAMSLSHS
jgi:hypothetical protein